MSARRFELHRDTDISGVSGTGVVAEGIEFSDGVVALRWLVPAGNPGSGNPTSVVFHDNGMASVEKIHGHSGATRIVHLDDTTPPTPGTDTERSPGGLVERVAEAIDRHHDEDVYLPRYPEDGSRCIDSAAARAAVLAMADWLDEQFRVSVVQQAACEWAADLIRREVEGAETS